MASVFIKLKCIAICHTKYLYWPEFCFLVIAMYTGNYYKPEGYHETSNSYRPTVRDEQRQAFLDYLAQPHWFEKVLREIKKRDREDDDCRSPETP